MNLHVIWAKTRADSPMSFPSAQVCTVLGSEFGTQSLGLQVPGGDCPGEIAIPQGILEWGSGTKLVRPEVIPPPTPGSFLLTACSLQWSLRSEACVRCAECKASGEELAQHSLDLQERKLGG